MRTTDSLRIGDAERDAAIAALTRHFTDGRLTQAEHEERTGLALTARTGADLRRLFVDLPRLSEPVPARPAVHRVVQPIIGTLAVVLGILMLVNLVPVFMLVAFAFLATRIAVGVWARPRHRAWRDSHWQGGPWQGGPWRGGNF